MSRGETGRQLAALSEYFRHVADIIRIGLILVEREDFEALSKIEYLLNAAVDIFMNEVVEEQ